MAPHASAGLPRLCGPCSGPNGGAYPRALAHPCVAVLWNTLVSFRYRQVVQEGNPNTIVGEPLHKGFQSAHDSIFFGPRQALEATVCGTLRHPGRAAWKTPGRGAEGVCGEVREGMPKGAPGRRRSGAACVDAWRAGCRRAVQPSAGVRRVRSAAAHSTRMPTERARSSTM